MSEQYISKSAVLAEIESIVNETNYKPFTDEVLGERKVCKDIKDFLDTLETKELEEDEELTGLEKEVAYGTVERINRKRIPIDLKGDLKAKFKNEFNTMWQVIDGIQFAKVAKHIIERLCLEFATWGAYNLKGIGEIKPEEKEKIDGHKEQHMNRFDLPCPHNDNRSCDHCRLVTAQDGWRFRGCFCPPNKGKYIMDIDECPAKVEI